MTGALADDDYVPPLHNAAVTSRESPRPWSCPVEDVSRREVTSATSVVHSSTADRVGANTREGGCAGQLACRSVLHCWNTA